MPQVLLSVPLGCLFHSLIKYVIIHEFSTSAKRDKNWQFLQTCLRNPHPLPPAANIPKKTEKTKERKETRSLHLTAEY